MRLGNRMPAAAASAGAGAGAAAAAHDDPALATGPGGPRPDALGRRRPAACRSRHRCRKLPVRLLARVHLRVLRSIGAALSMVILGAATADTAVVRLASGLGCRGRGSCIERGGGLLLAMIRLLRFRRKAQGAGKSCRGTRTQVFMPRYRTVLKLACVRGWDAPGR